MHDLLRFAHHFMVLTHFARHVLAGLLLMLVLIAVLLAAVERLGFGEALYFTLITGLTVGYGDIVPDTLVGRIASVVAAFTGLMLTGLYIAIATKALSLAVEERTEATRQGSGDHRRSSR